ncbi:RsmB/NOP family class I SAM-dependent RNA methyltransferase [bacterium]|nr:MAG: RsmB/NOP family class I SAM-dependent RNA methyltransferase [bacterium]
MKTDLMGSYRWWRREGDKLPNPSYAQRIFSAAGPVEEFILSSRGPLDAEVQNHQRALRMGKNDRALLGMGVYGLARSLKALTEATGGVREPGVLLGLGYLDQIKPELRPCEYFTNYDYKSALERADELRERWFSSFCEETATSLSELPVEAKDALSSYLSIPSFWLDFGPWKTVGEALSELLEGKKRQSLQIRANTLKTGREELKRDLYSSGIASDYSEFSPTGLMIPGAVNVAGLPSFKEGLFEIQDEGSQLIALACGAKPGQKVLDLCAGSGGKSLALAALMENRGLIVAHDNARLRLLRSDERIRRSGATIIKPLSAYEEVAGSAPYDVVLVDAPCSSTGTLRRNPDVSWRWKKADILSFSKVQRELLQKGSELVKRGGKLVYSTCSLLAPENRFVAEKFLENNRNFSPAKVLPGLPFSCIGSEGVRLPLNLPGYEGDGYFIASFLKI